MFKKNIYMTILLVLLLVTGASGLAAISYADGNKDVQPENKIFLLNNIEILKRNVPNLVIYKIKPINVNGFNELETSIGKIFMSDTGEVLLDGHTIVLFNYDDVDLTKQKNINQVIEKSSNQKILNSNTDKNRSYYLVNNHATLITNKTIKTGSIAMIGAFTTVNKLAKLVQKHKTFKKKDIKTTKSTPKFTSDQILAKKREGRVKALTWIKQNYPQNLITFKAKNGNKGLIYIFTDYTCPHCRDLHKHLDELTDNGYSVSYILLPRAGIESKASKNMQKALCSVNQKKQVESLYQTGHLSFDIKERSNCAANIANNLSFTKGFGVDGTPYIIASNGYQTSGFTNTFLLVDKLHLKG